MSRMRLTGVVVLTLTALACSDESTPASLEPVRLPCMQMNEVMRQFGATLRADSPFVLGAYVTTRDGVSSFQQPVDPNTGVSGPGCSLQVTSNLKSLCEQEFGHGPCGNPGDFDTCLAAVEIAMTTDCSVCGNGVCEFDEAQLSFSEGGAQWNNNCPADCECGNGVCQPDKEEHIFSCPTDCPPACGDGFCSGFEVCGSCADLPYTPPEGCTTCDADCCHATCGDGVCQADAGETKANCEQDCALGSCGDGMCLGGETERTCIDCFNGWKSHCLDEDCREDGPCRDAREHCGDGLCMGCEQWTCAADCGDAGHLPCLTGADTCPAGSCGDGSCERPIENAINCPLDCRWHRADDAPPETCDELTMLSQPALCVGNAMFTSCGDGFCSVSENDTGCPDDCRVGPGQCVGLGAPDASGRMCAKLSMTGAVTGMSFEHWVIVSSSDNCRVAEVCRDTCGVIGGRATCLDCGWINGELEATPCGDESTRCIDATSASVCLDDPANPGILACKIRRAVSCNGGCSNGVCAQPALVPCLGGACGTCGNGVCDPEETIGNCEADCACRAACYFSGYDRDEIECPAAFAACNCGDHNCRDWERAGEWACPADCGGM